MCSILRLKRQWLMMMGLWIALFHPLIHAQDVTLKKLSELDEGSIICYFTKDNKLTTNKANSYYYRKLIKRDAGKGNGSYIVQDFYSKINKKQVDPFMLMDIDELYSFLISSIDGYYVQWYPNGNKELETVYNKGQQQGKYTIWYESGKLKNELFYDKGELHGISTLWSEDGIKIVEAAHSHGKLHGIVQKWYDDGTRRLLQEYKNGVKHGRYIEWSSDKPAITGSYKDNQRDGTWSWWDVNGNKISEGNYNNDNEEGLWTIWDNSGRRRQEINYKKGSYDGLVTRWDEQGNLYIREMYEHGRRIWRKEPFSLKEL